MYEVYANEIAYLDLTLLGIFGHVMEKSIFAKNILTKIGLKFLLVFFWQGGQVGRGCSFSGTLVPGKMLLILHFSDKPQLL